jgi:hypothetical protein
MSRAMRAKMIANVVQHKNDKGEVVSENMNFVCVAACDYPDSGLDENNSFAKWSPHGGAHVTCVNPALFGQIKSGDTFYVDFVRADK